MSRSSASLNTVTAALGRHAASADTAGRVPPVRRHVAHLARRFQQICLGIIAEVLEPEGLTPVQYAALASLDDAPGIEQHRLAERIGIDQVSAHHLVEGLASAGLVRRRVAADDRRARVLNLTRRGTVLRRRLKPAMMSTQDRILAPILPDERDALVALLTRVIEGNEIYARPGNGRRRPQRKAE